MPEGEAIDGSACGTDMARARGRGSIRTRVAAFSWGLRWLTSSRWLPTTSTPSSQACPTRQLRSATTGACAPFNLRGGSYAIDTTAGFDAGASVVIEQQMRVAAGDVFPQFVGRKGEYVLRYRQVDGVPSITQSGRTTVTLPDKGSYRFRSLGANVQRLSLKGTSNG